MVFKKTALALLGAVGLAALVGCTQVDTKEIQGTRWKPTTLMAEPVPNKTTAIITFSKDGKIYGNAGCNTVVGGYNT